MTTTTMTREEFLDLHRQAIATNVLALEHDVVDETLVNQKLSFTPTGIFASHADCDGAEVDLVEVVQNTLQLLAVGTHPDDVVRADRDRAAIASVLRWAAIQIELNARTSEAHVGADEAHNRDR